MSSGSSAHSHFEELCALASIGQISSSEYQELSTHLRACSSCRDSYAELCHLTQVQFPLLAARKLPTPKADGFLARVTGKDYKSRFAARARELGLEIPSTQKPGLPFGAKIPAFAIPRWSYQHTSIVIILTLLVVVGISSRRWKQAEARNAAMSAQVSKLSEQSASLQQQVEMLSQGKQTVETDLWKTRSDGRGLAIRVRELEEQGKKDALALQELNAQLNASNDRDHKTQLRIQETQQALQAANQELAILRAYRSENDAAAVSQQLQAAELSGRVKEQEELIEKQQKLLAVDSDVRNLMAARSLHITDVFDVDGKGKKKRAFGRVFYTEGKSLIFYAFDLDASRELNVKHSFQAWGQLADSSTSAVNLGIFYVDDPAQKRWMLKFDNPQVLRQLNAVFVTAEPHGGARRPTGQKLMYAYLGHEPNHP